MKVASIPEGSYAPGATVPLGQVQTVKLPHVQVGDIVLVKVDEQVRRPLLVSAAHPDGSVSGSIFCEPEDHTRPAFRGWESGDGARITGRPDRLLALGYGELLQPGSKLGQWIPRPTNLPARS